ncbi:uncharacterized protein LOC133179296 [Saccostrea echinata]|uniref:uncharacterized protein LOC133179296 n=1 Tax=Saccostrea echinata TaxID=191078 RepID=UPI002A814B9A|nr:uncharacterized protein LOC133179296 [Saccostrea echinata]
MGGNCAQVAHGTTLSPALLADQAFARSFSTNYEALGRNKAKYNERHSREKLENFLKEFKINCPDNLQKELGKAWEEYTWLLRSEKTLAYKYPQQFFTSLKNPKSRKKYTTMRLDQSPLSKLISSNRSSQWREGAQIQLESLQASDQLLAQLRKSYDMESPEDSDINLYPEGCDGKQSILNLFLVTEKDLQACHKKEYVKLVCKEAALKREFPEKYEKGMPKLSQNAEDIKVEDLDKRIKNKGPLYEFIKYFTKGNNEIIAKLSLQDYYILSTAEELLCESDPNSEWTYRYPEDIKDSATDQPTVASNPVTQNVTGDNIRNTFQGKPSTQETLNKAGSTVKRNDQENKVQGHMKVNPDSVTRPTDFKPVSKVLHRQNNIPGDEKQRHVPTENRNINTKPAGRRLERQNSNPQNEAFGAIPEPGDRRVTDWRTPYSDLHKAWSFQTSQIEELTNRLSSFASKQLTEGNAAFTDLSDKNRPTKIGEKFGLIYDDEWSEVFDELKDSGFNDEDIISKLQIMVEYGYDFCFKKALEQLQDLEQAMKIPILQPFHTKQTLHVPKDMAKILTAATVKHAKEYRKVTASISSPEVCKVFFREEADFIERTFQKSSSASKLKAYIEACIEQMWLMCVQDPQMVIEFAVPGTPIDKELFKFYDKKGIIVHLTVWPVVYLHKGGPIVSKGYVLPK